MKIAYLGDFPFPGSTAPTHRVRGIARALMAAGHEVTIVPLVRGDSLTEPDFRVDPSLVRQAEPRSVTNAAHTLFGGSRALTWITEHRESLDVAIVFGTPAALLARYLWRSRIHTGQMPPIVLDVVEWYDYASRPGGRLGPYSAEHALSMRLLAPRCSGAICISTFLANYMQSQGCPSVVVPPLFEPIQVPSRPAELGPNCVKIGYAGSPGAKDGLGLAHLVAASVALPPARRARVRIHIVGLNAADGHALLHRYAPFASTDLEDTVVWHGRTSSSEAQQIIAACDFSYLQRPKARYAMAGFPTKVVESLMLGTPVIANATSDLATYLVDGENGVSLDRGGVDGTTLSAVASALERITTPGFRLALTRQEIRDRSCQEFRPQGFAASLDEFVTRAAEGNV